MPSVRAPDDRPASTPLLRHWLARLGRSTARRERAKGAAPLVRACRTLLSERGESSGARLAAEVQARYEALDGPARNAFFESLVADFSPDPASVAAHAAAYASDPSPARLVALQAVVEPPRQELFRRINLAPGGTRLLVALRRDLMQTLSTHPQRIGIDADLAHLFRSWFNRGFLVLQRIEWRTSAVVLERLIAYEAVHAIKGWRDLRRRLAGDRRCYAFFHPAWPDEPLIFIEVALTRGMSASVQPLLDPESPVMDPARADAATFYSITNTQDGLRGVSFGNFLIKQVVDDLGHEFPRLRTMATLSPVPGLARWLRWVAASPAADRLSPALRRLLAADVPDRSALDAASVRDEVLDLCAAYLIRAKRERAPIDPVARFHLANGARLERLNWLADTSPNGMRGSLGVMANYRYRLDDLERNHEAYARECRVVAAAPLERAARQCRVDASRSLESPGA